jgi:hypothetical protein
VVDAIARVLEAEMGFDEKAGPDATSATAPG